MTAPDLAQTADAAPRFVSAEALRAVLGYAEAVDALQTGLASRDPGAVDPVARVAVEVPGEQSEMLLMPSYGSEGAGVKLVTLARGNPARGVPMIQGLYALFSRESLSPELLIDGAGLTRLRTAAVSALATRALARADSRRLVVFGAGVQGAAHVEAMRAVLPIEDVVVVGSDPSSARAEALVRRLNDDGVVARLGSPRSVDAADVICTCTTSREPVFRDADVAAGAHVNAVGAYQPTMCELPPGLLSRALFVVETEAAALAEAGDVVHAIAVGSLPPTGFAHELSALIDGRIRRQTPEQTTVFKSVGLSVEDLILARAVADRLDS